MKNIVEKSEIARFKHFHPFPQCFSSMCLNEYIGRKGLNVAQMMKFASNGMEKHGGNIISPFSTMFSNVLFHGVINPLPDDKF